MLSLEHVCKRYRRPRGFRLALDDVSLELVSGQIMGIYGPSGSGKTTLLRIAAGLESADSGTVLYDGERLDEMSVPAQRRHRRRNVGCVWARQPWAAGLSAWEHVQLPLLVDGCEHRMAQNLAHKALLACEVEHCAETDPQELSDGERRRVAIARALVIRPRLLLVDGAVSGLSIIEQEAIMALLASLAHEAKVAVLVADSGAGEMQRADPILYLRDGRLITAAPTAREARLYTLPTASLRRTASDA